MRPLGVLAAIRAEFADAVDTLLWRLEPAAAELPAERVEALVLAALQQLDTSSVESLADAGGGHGKAPASAPARALPPAAVSRLLGVAVSLRLPDGVALLDILGRLPPALQAWSAKRVCKAARERFRGATAVSLRCPDLPPVAVREAYAACRAERRRDAQEWLSEARAECGDVARLAWLRSQACAMGRVCTAAAGGGHVAVLRWARTRRPRLAWGAEVCEAAALGGHLDVLAWVAAQPGAPALSADVCAAAAAGGHLHVLAWARERGAPWSPRTCAAAAAGGQLAALQWLRAQQPEPCPWDSLACALAAKQGHVAVLSWLRSQDPPAPWDVHTCGAAACGGSLEALRWLRAQDPPCPWHQAVCCEAAQHGRLEVLEWARAQPDPAPWSEQVCKQAAAAGHLDLLRWLHSREPPCPWDRAACAAAAWERGHDAVADWARAQPA
ncbi:RXLR124 [Scenedesmus sp. PABB004]|nr:RXLR124 [Scenedesmus sp. PABB004]